MNEYRIIAKHPSGATKEFYAQAESAEDIQAEIEVRMADEISRGLEYRIEKL